MLEQTRAIQGPGYRGRIWLLVVVALLAVAVTAFVPPVAQDPDYHLFADQRVLFGIPNFGDTASNFGFLIVGVLGIAFVLSAQGRALFTAPGKRWPYLIFFAGVALVSVGSAYYHLDPSTETLFWDRLPMTVAFMALFAAFIMDRVDSRIGLIVMLPLLLALGFGSVIYWHMSEAAGHGDLRPYGLVQFYPMLAIPLICLLFPGHVTAGRYVVYMVLWYTLAKLCELFDGEIFALLGHTVSGHALKHLAAALAAYMVLAMLRAATVSPAPHPKTADA